ncbi:MAG: hypothetical protein M1376_05555 [Planctomycetes bacterium]|nr:hypothetical protein [Planctomycetota bacterium]
MIRFSLVVASVLGLVLGAAGCPTEPKRSSLIWQGEKIGEIAAPPRDRAAPPVYLVTVSLDVHVLEMPADNVEQLQAVWQILSATPIRLMSYNAFSENSFRLLYGKMELWPKIQDLLVAADAQPVTTVTLTIADNDKTDLPIAELPIARPITFVATDLSKQMAHVGSGLLALRLVAQPIPWARGVRKIVGFPVYTLPTSGAIPELQTRVLQREFPFNPAAFACQMGPGDLLVLGPETYTGERTTLGGLFFNEPADALFFNVNKPKPPQRRPAVRVYILVCTQVSDG